MARSPTLIWCDTCEAWQPCRSENAAEWGYESNDIGKIDFDDGTHGFRRLRYCAECGEVFFTVEISERAIMQRDNSIEAVKKSAAKLKDAVSKLK